MNIRAIAPVVVGLAVAALAGCGSSDDSAATATSAVTVTRTVTPSAPSTTVPTPVVTETVTSTGDAPTDDSDDNAAQPVRSAPTATSSFVGHYQAHDADMDITRDGTGWMDLGDGAANYERWRTAWSPSGSSITVRLVRRDELRGVGMSGTVGQGTTFSATFTSGSQGITILHMTKGGQKYVDWCDVNRFGGAYECGA
ncbi:hypothetical protein [Williamsia herbipolensis]|uniref:hypothetical protein n=1 Tax=Williamsia herbipolensis TaxID=1603258 RepID=UPI0012371BFF|nr:hypothetical protein [Williamsia herbipolensis]